MGAERKLSGGEWETAGLMRKRMVHGAESMGGEAEEDRGHPGEIRFAFVKYASLSLT